MEDRALYTAQFINTTSSHIFLTGKAGTGKTTFLKNLKQLTHKNFIVVAPTGIAALNAGGVTIHSQFLLPPLTFLPDRNLQEGFSRSDGQGRVMNQHVLARKHPLNSTRKQVLRAIDLLVIDEVSMLRADLLDAVDYRMKAARGNSRQSFGGVQVLFIGDLYQLPPVISRDEQEVLSRYYKSGWFYEAKALEQEPPVYIELDKIFRQHDPLFIGILNNLRNNTVTNEDIDELNTRFMPGETGNVNGVITLTTHNYKADDLNQRELKKISSPSHFFDAVIEGDFPESMHPVLHRLELKEGAQIMFTRNDTSEEKIYVNGNLATVTTIRDGEISVKMAETLKSYTLTRERWENKKYSMDNMTQELQEEIIGSFEQYPVKLAWAITVHKSQGLTFDKAIIDVGHAFAPGQVYVALSRLRCLEGLMLRTRIPLSVISTDEQVVAFSRANHQPDRLSEVMKERQRQFVLQLMDKTFDFQPLIKEINSILKDIEPGFSEGTMKPVLIQIKDMLETERTNTEKFRKQLTDLVVDGHITPLLNRIDKGRNYYRTFLIQVMRLLLEHLEVMKQRKRVKTYVHQLNELDQALNKKWEEVDKAYLLTEGILSGNTEFEFAPLNAKRMEERTALLRELSVNDSGQAPRKRKAKTDRKQKKGDERTTYDITLELFKAGLTAEQIAANRGLVVSTIEGHLAKAIESNLLDVHSLLKAEELEEISTAMGTLPENSVLKNLFDSLRGKYSYGKLKAATTFVRNRKNQVLP